VCDDYMKGHWSWPRWAEMRLHVQNKRDTWWRKSVFIRRNS